MKTPTTTAEFKKFIATASTTQLVKAGFSPWDKTRKLYLIPGKMYKIIPNGTALVDIFGKSEKFKSGVSDDDCRFGCLPYGILIKSKK